MMINREKRMKRNCLLGKKRKPVTMSYYFRKKTKYDFCDSITSFFPKSKMFHLFWLNCKQTYAKLVSWKSWMEEKKEEEERLRNAIINGKEDFGDEYKIEVLYLHKRNKLELYPYSFIESYYSMEESIEVFEDCQQDLKYVVHNDKKLYFPNLSNQQIKSDYIQLVMEQDRKSPHLYFSNSISFNGGIFVDVGCAEGMISLNVIDKADEVYLIERSPQWIKALNNTFVDYKSKIHIVPQIAGIIDDEPFITIDRLLSKYRNKDIFIKMDVEGMEMDVLQGCREVMKRNKCSFSCATYHTKKMEKKVISFFNNNNYNWEVSDGYMLFFYGHMTLENGMYERQEYPYFRRGLVRAKSKELDIR